MAVEPLPLGIANWRDELAPAGETTLVFRDSAFADDVAKTNLAAILGHHGDRNAKPYPARQVRRLILKCRLGRYD